MESLGSVSRLSLQNILQQCYLTKVPDENEDCGEDVSPDPLVFGATPVCVCDRHQHPLIHDTQTSKCLINTDQQKYWDSSMHSTIEKMIMALMMVAPPGGKVSN